jgi:hypothetical protein
MKTPPITNAKLTGLEPRWASFRGVSLLFENPPSPAGRSLYRHLNNGLRSLAQDPLVEQYLFRFLPARSQHVTVWDGVNDGNLSRVVLEFCSDWKHFLEDIPKVSSTDPLLQEVLQSTLIQRPDWNLHLRCEQIENWSDVSLVARLVPTDEASEDSLQQLIQARDTLSDAYEARFGIRPHPCYTPHITLGYFANHDLAAASADAVQRWNELLLEKTAGQILSLHRVGLSLFEHMASFGE